MNIRKSDPKDAEYIAKIHTETWKKVYVDFIPKSYLDNLSIDSSIIRWKKLLSSEKRLNTACFVAISKNEIIGFIIGGPNRDKDKEIDGELYAIYVDQKHHKTGAGKKLFKTFVNHLIKNNYSAMKLWVLENNPARKFYEKQGGVFSGETKEVKFDNSFVIEVSYIWNNLEKL